MTARQSDQGRWENGKRGEAGEFARVRARSGDGLEKGLAGERSPIRYLIPPTTFGPQHQSILNHQSIGPPPGLNPAGTIASSQQVVGGFLSAAAAAAAVTASRNAAGHGESHAASECSSDISKANGTPGNEQVLVSSQLPASALPTPIILPSPPPAHFPHSLLEHPQQQQYQQQYQQQLDLHPPPPPPPPLPRHHRQHQQPAALQLQHQPAQPLPSSLSVSLAALRRLATTHSAGRLPVQRDLSSPFTPSTASSAAGPGTSSSPSTSYSSSSSSFSFTIRYAHNNNNNNNNNNININATRRGPHDMDRSNNLQQQVEELPDDEEEQMQSPVSPATLTNGIAPSSAAVALLADQRAQAQAQAQAGVEAALAAEGGQAAGDAYLPIHEGDDTQLSEDQLVERSPSVTTDSTFALAGARRPRGRPRKNPLPTTVLDPSAKIQKGRSKTGCITCRRRKKKCDEQKPHSRLERKSKPPRELPILIEGIETEVDQHLLNHFVNTVSLVLVSGSTQNPFKEILLPMAQRHKGLMHSLLCLSGSHLASNVELKRYGFRERQIYHYEFALRNLRVDKQLTQQANGTSLEPVEDPVVAQVLVMMLEAICRGNTNGEYRFHLDAARNLVQSHTTANQEFSKFIFEFFSYHDVANSITSLDRRPLNITENFRIPEFILQPDSAQLLGVLDGLFGYLSKITQLRDLIRWRRNQQLEPMADYQTLVDAVAIDAELRSWQSPHPKDTNRYIASQLYRQATWVYLYRTVHPSKPSPKINDAVNEGLELLKQLPPDSETHSVLLMPLFLIGCAAFVPEQRQDLRRWFGTLKRYSNLGNIEPAREVVEKVWSLMDAGADAWDWEAIISGMGYDFLVT
ncbi:MAG: hypothetical protein M1829_003965 [Trizodia sp. TS-e1964]|nr:MAG: hypothetical protein M1829_003965 [Trizodia sp. TS-e1964]